ncbi:hypothetical protein D5047_02230 [Verminephrobacter eiseniae]|nr:hypothetical protein [Verminephrobacter eiseniae]
MEQTFLPSSKALAHSLVPVFFRPAPTGLTDAAQRGAAIVAEHPCAHPANRAALCHFHPLAYAFQQSTESTG